MDELEHHTSFIMLQNTPLDLCPGRQVLSYPLAGSSEALRSLLSLSSLYHHKVTWVDGLSASIGCLPVVRNLTHLSISLVCATDRFVPRPCFAARCRLATTCATNGA